jgi:hypothetical protein
MGLKRRFIRHRLCCGHFHPQGFLIDARDLGNPVDPVTVKQGDKVAFRGAEHLTQMMSGDRVQLDVRAAIKRLRGV